LIQNPYAMHAAPTAVQVTSAHVGQSDPLGKFTAHRRYNRPIVQALMTNAGTRDIGRVIANCAQRLLLEIPVEGDALDQPLLRGARLCNRRLCPFCEWRRTRALRARLIAGLNTFSLEKPKWRGLFLTLTVRNCQVHEVRDTVKHMHDSLHRLIKTKAWPTGHWLRRTEITVKRELMPEQQGRTAGTTESLPHLPSGRIQSVHPHLHCLLLVRPSYFSHGYVTQLQWQKEWQMAARLDYAPVVDVRVAKTQANDDHLVGVAPVSAVLEAAKYAAKATDLLALGEQLPELHWQIRGTRLFGVSRDLRRHISEGDVVADELLDTDRFPVPVLVPSLTAVAQWFDSAQEYRFAE
jgi:plasmid rolling circle replication initiator protein Rep